MGGDVRLKYVFVLGRQLRFKSVFMAVSGDPHIIETVVESFKCLYHFISSMYVLVCVCVCVLYFCDLFWSYV